MSSYMITGDEFTASGLRVEESVYETIIRLEEAKYGLRKAEDGEIREALDFIKSRWMWGKEFLRTSFDRTLTGGYRRRMVNRSEAVMLSYLLVNLSTIFIQHTPITSYPGRRIETR